MCHQSTTVCHRVFLPRSHSVISISVAMVMQQHRGKWRGYLRPPPPLGPGLRGAVSLAGAVKHYSLSGGSLCSTIVNKKLFLKKSNKVVLMSSVTVLVRFSLFRNLCLTKASIWSVYTQRLVCHQGR